MKHIVDKIDNDSSNNGKLVADDFNNRTIEMKNFLTYKNVVLSSTDNKQISHQISTFSNPVSLYSTQFIDNGNESFNMKLTVSAGGLPLPSYINLSTYYFSKDISFAGDNHSQYLSNISIDNLSYSPTNNQKLLNDLVGIATYNAFTLEVSYNNNIFNIIKQYEVETDMSLNHSTNKLNFQNFYGYFGEYEPIGNINTPPYYKATNYSDRNRYIYKYIKWNPSTNEWTSGSFKKSDYPFLAIVMILSANITGGSGHFPEVITFKPMDPVVEVSIVNYNKLQQSISQGLTFNWAKCIITEYDDVNRKYKLAIIDVL